VIILWILCVCIPISLQAFVDPVPGENLWRLTSRIGTTVDTIESEVDIISSLNEALISQIEQLDDDIISVSDIMTSQIETIEHGLSTFESVVTSTVEQLDQDLLSIGDVLESTFDVLSPQLTSISELLLSELDAISSAIISAQDTIVSAIESTQEILLSTLDLLEECTIGTPITTAPFVITTPGIYQVCANLTLTTGTSPIIAIDTSNVTLNLGGYTLTTGATNYGIAISSTSGAVTDVQICNGSFVINNASHLEAIIARTVSGLTIEDIAVFNAPDANISIGSDCHSVLVQNCTFTGSNGSTIAGGTTPATVYIDGLYGSPTGVTDTVTVRSCVASNGVIRGVTCNHCSNITIQDVSVLEAQTSGIRVNLGTTNVCCTNCITTNTSIGFWLQNNSTVLTNCISSGQTNNDGFIAAIGSSNINFVECIACSNGTGFEIAGTDCLLKRCVAANNSSVGILVDASATNTQIFDSCPVNNPTNITDNGTNTVFINLTTVFDILLSAIESISSCCSILDTLETVVESVADALISISDASTSTLSTLAPCLLGSTITQSMAPYTITTSGYYTLCGDITINSMSPAITISANNVTLDLNGYTITNSQGRGILCNAVTNVAIMNGSIMPLQEAIAILGGCQDVFVQSIQAINSAQPAFNIVGSTGIMLEYCTSSNWNSTTVPSTPTTAVYVGTSGDVIVRNCIVNSIRNPLFIYGLTTSDPTGPIEISNCTVTDTVSAGFYILNTTGYTSGPIFDVTLQNCLADTTGTGFLIQGAGTAPHYSIGPTLVRCTAQNTTQFGFSFNSIQQTVMSDCMSIISVLSGVAFNGVINSVCQRILSQQAPSGSGFEILNATNCTFRSCTVTNNLNGFFIASTTSAVTLDNCLASNNSGPGINNSGSNVTIVDTRSSNGATTTNPAYNLNGAADLLGTATLIITS
jgi:parallel beta-helix repeat protein